MRMEAQHQGLIREIRNGTFDSEEPRPFGADLVTNRSLDEVVLEFLQEEEGLGPLALELVNDVVLHQGSRPELSMVVIEETTGRPIAGALVKLTLISTQDKPLELYAGVSDTDGRVDAAFEIPEILEADLAVLCRASAAGKRTVLRRMVHAPVPRTPRGWLAGTGIGPGPETRHRSLTPGAFHLAILHLLLLPLPLVEQPLSAGERDLDLDASTYQVELGRHQGHPPRLGFLVQLPDLAGLQQQLSRAHRVLIVHGRVSVGAEVDAVQEHLALLDLRVAFAQVDAAQAGRLDLRTGQHDAGLESLEQVKLVSGGPVGGENRLRAVLLGPGGHALAPGNDRRTSRAAV